MSPRCSERQQLQAALFTHAVDRWLLGESHLHGLLVAEQAVGQRVVETFNDCLVSVNFNAPADNGCFVVFHLFSNSAQRSTRELVFP